MTKPQIPVKLQITGFKFQFLFTVFATLVAFNLVRLFCQKFCLQTRWYQVILNDNLHHYQLGLILIPVAIIILRKYQKIRNFVLAISIGMIIDESMYLFYPLNPKFSHNTPLGVIAEFTVFLLFILAYAYFSKNSH